MIIKKNRNYLIFSLCGTVIFIILSVLVHKDIFRSIDLAVLTYLQKTISRVLDIPFSYLTIIGSTEISLIFIMLFFLFNLFHRKGLRLSIFLFFLIYLVEFLGKLYVFHPLPPFTFSRYALNIRLPSSFIIRTDFSYPSGHVARMTFITMILLYFLLRKKTLFYNKLFFLILLFSFLIAVFISRVYLGEHWPSDVLGGFILGASLSSLAISLW